MILLLSRHYALLAVCNENPWFDMKPEAAITDLRADRTKAVADK